MSNSNLVLITIIVFMLGFGIALHKDYEKVIKGYQEIIVSQDSTISNWHETTKEIYKDAKELERQRDTMINVLRKHKCN